MWRFVFVWSVVTGHTFISENIVVVNSVSIVADIIFINLRQKNQTQINKYNIRNNRNRVDHDYNVRDKGMPSNHTSYKYS